MVDDLSDSSQELRRLRHDVDRLQVATPLQNASIGSGGLRVYGGGVITIENGGLSVTGFATISGELNGNGTINWTGPVNFSGPVQITGTLDVTAETRLRGETTIEGIARLLSDLQVEGKITAGNVTIEPDKITIGGVSPSTLENGEFTLSNGAKLKVGLTSGGSAIGLVPQGGGVDISASSSLAWMRAVGSVVSVSTSQVRMSAAFTVMEQLPTASSLSGLDLVGRDSASGRLYAVPASLLA